MHDVLKHLNDANPCDLQTLDAVALRRLEVLCETTPPIAPCSLSRAAASELIAFHYEEERGWHIGVRRKALSAPPTTCSFCIESWCK